MQCYIRGFLYINKLKLNIMITEKEFQEALKIVNEYVSQLNNTITQMDDKIKKTPIAEWITAQKMKNNLNNNHTRLFSFLNYILTEDYDYKYIQDFENVDLSRFRNAGKKTQEAFNELYYGYSNQAGI